MRSLEKNKQKVFCRLKVADAEQAEILDDYGNPTGEFKDIDSPEPIELWINVSAAKGENATRQFGELDEYDKVLATARTDLPIDEETVFWIDNLDTGQPHDYEVTKIAGSINGKAYAVKKVHLGKNN